MECVLWKLSCFLSCKFLSLMKQFHLASFLTPMHFLLKTFLILSLLSPFHYPIFVRIHTRESDCPFLLMTTRMNKHSICHWLCQQMATKSIIQSLNESQDMAHAWSCHAVRIQTLHCLKVLDVRNAMRSFAFYFWEISPTKAFIFKIKLFNLTEERVSRDSEGSGQNLAYFPYSFLS